MVFFCVVGSSDFEVTVGAALASSSRGSSWWLGARWLAVGGGTGRWRAAERTCVFIALWRREFCGAYPLFIARARFEFSRSRVFIASFGRRGRPSPLQLRATCCRIRLRLFRHAATSVLRGLPAFYRSGAFCAFPAFLSSRLAFGADGVGYGTAGLGGGWHLRRSPRRRGGGRWGRRLVWADGAVARARLWRFFLSPCVGRGAPRRVTVLEDSARTAGGVLSSAASWQSGQLLHAPGRGSAFLRRPRSVLMRRTGHFLVGFEGRPTFVQHSRAVDVADRKSGRDLSASWRSLAVVVPPRGCGVRSRGGGQGSAALCGRL